MVRYWHRGLQHKAEPVLWVRQALTQAFWDEAELASATNAYLDGAAESLRSQLVPLGIGYRRFSIDAFISAERLEIATLLRSHAWRPVPPLARERVRRELARVGAVPWHEVIRGEHALLQPHEACRLIFDGSLRLVPSDRLRPDSRIELNESPSNVKD